MLLLNGIIAPSPALDAQGEDSISDKQFNNGRLVSSSTKEQQY